MLVRAELSPGDERCCAPPRLVWSLPASLVFLLPRPITTLVGRGLPPPSLLRHAEEEGLVWCTCVWQAAGWFSLKPAGCCRYDACGKKKLKMEGQERPLVPRSALAHCWRRPTHLMHQKCLVGRPYEPCRRLSLALAGRWAPHAPHSSQLSPQWNGCTSAICTCAWRSRHVTTTTTNTTTDTPCRDDHSLYDN